MKRIVFLLIALSMSMVVFAQHKPLKQIELKDAYLSRSGSGKSYNTGNTREIYTAYFNLGHNSIGHHKGIKDYDLGYDAWVIDIHLNPTDAVALNLYATMEESFSKFYVGTAPLCISVGGAIYEIATWYYSDTGFALMMDINKLIAQHISISGFQGILVGDVEIIAFSDIDQEQWRRAAKEVYETRKNL